MPEMTAPNGTTRDVPAAGVEALRALGWTGAEPEQPDPEPEQPSSKPRARGSRASSKASKED